MPEVTFDIELFCKVCNERLSADVDRHSDIYVEPCEKCLEDEVKDSYDNGFNDGCNKTREELENA